MRLGLGNFASARRDAGDPAAGRLFISVGGEEGRGEFGGVPDSVAGSGSVARSPEHVRNAVKREASEARALHVRWLTCGPRGAGPGRGRSRYLAARDARNVGFAGRAKWKTRAHGYFGLDAVTTRVGFERKLHGF